MNLSIAYWVTLLIWLIFSLIYGYPLRLEVSAGTVLLFILFVLIGLQIFGSPIKR